MRSTARCRPKGCQSWEKIWLIAQLGEFLGRKRDGEPGAKTLWFGLSDFAVPVTVMQAMRGW